MVYVEQTKTYKGLRVGVKKNHTDNVDVSKSHVLHMIHMAFQSTSKNRKKEKPLIWVKTTNKISSQKSKVTTSPRSLDNIQKARPSQAELLKIDKEGIITLLCLKIDKHGKATLLKWNCIETTAAGVCTGL